MANQIKLETPDYCLSFGDKRKRMEDSTSVGNIPKRSAGGKLITRKYLIGWVKYLLHKLDGWDEDIVVKLTNDLKGLTARIEELGMTDLIEQINTASTMEGEGKGKRMEENTGEDELVNILKRSDNGEQGNYVTTELFFEWGQRLLVELEERQKALAKRMVVDFKVFSAPIKKVTEILKDEADEIKMKREWFEKEKEMEAKIKRLQDELKYKLEIKCEASGNEHDERNRGIKLEASPTPTTVLGAATSASATVHREA